MSVRNTHLDDHTTSWRQDVMTEMPMSAYDVLVSLPSVLTAEEAEEFLRVERSRSVDGGEKT